MSDQSDQLATTDEAPFEVVLPMNEGSCSGGSCSRAQGPELRYRPLHPTLFGRSFRADWLVESFAGALQDGSEQAVRSILREEVPGKVFSFEMLREEFCTMLLDELQHYEESGNPVARPNSMNNYGALAARTPSRALRSSARAPPGGSACGAVLRPAPQE